MRKLSMDLLSNEDGGGLFFAIIIVLVVSIFIKFSLVYEEAYAIAESIGDALESSARNLITENYNEIFDGAKGDIFIDVTYNEATGTFDRIKDQSNLYEQMQEQLGLEKVSSTKYCKGDLYCISNIKTDILEGERVIYRGGAKFRTTVSVDVSINAEFWGVIHEIEYTPSRTANFTPKYINE